LPWNESTFLPSAKGTILIFLKTSTKKMVGGKEQEKNYNNQASGGRII
jgi:hypothetical protein